METATQTGVEEEKVVVVGNTERNDALARIAEAARKERDGEIEADTEDKEAAGADETGQPEEKAAPPEEKKDEELVTVRVDGHEMQVPKSQILDFGVRAYQKETVADKRLEEAVRIKREAEEYAAQVKASTDQVLMADDIDLARRIREGSEEEAAEAIKILKGREQATPEQIASVVETRVRNQVNLERDFEWFKTEFKDIVSDPHLKALADAEDARMLAAGDTRPDRERWAEAGKVVRDKLTEWRGGSAQPASIPEEKREKKKNITNIQAANIRKESPETTKPKTQAEIIEEMRKRRGQA